MDPLIRLITASSDVIRLLEFKDRECFPPATALSPHLAAPVSAVSPEMELRPLPAPLWAGLLVWVWQLGDSELRAALVSRASYSTG